MRIAESGMWSEFFAFRFYFLVDYDAVNLTWTTLVLIHWAPFVRLFLIQ